MIVKTLLKQFLAYMKTHVPLFLQNTGASEGTITGLEGLASSIICFDVPFADRLKLVIDRLQIWLNLLIVLKSGIEALVK